MTITNNPRRAAYEALLSEGYIADYLSKWNEQTQPKAVDFHLAQEIAYGTERMQLALKHYSQQLGAGSGLKRKERLLLYTALYQFVFMDRVPPYAIVNETVAISKNTCHPTFTKFLNAILRKVEKTPWEKPLNSLSDLFSFPQYYTDLLVHEFGIDQAKEILHWSNIPPRTMVRRRPTFEVETVEDLKDYHHNPSYYIQNITPVKLFQFLVEKTQHHPNTVLDLCASPGGKTILAHDSFPQAHITAVDVSQHKIKILRENLDKYHIEASVVISEGEKFATDQKFDLIIIDAPCSNTGVLNKRAEARWRLNEETLTSLSQLQLKLLNHAKTLLSKKGQIWFMTCSILKIENEEVIIRSGMDILHTHTFLPHQEFDGGFCAALT